MDNYGVLYSKKKIKKVVSWGQLWSDVVRCGQPSSFKTSGWNYCTLIEFFFFKYPYYDIQFCFRFCYTTFLPRNRLKTHNVKPLGIGLTKLYSFYYVLQ
jgi:hypothetical protein